MARAAGRREVSCFLFTRGLWLVLLEVTVVRFAWTFSLFPEFVVLQVIWAIGVSMIVLAGLIHLPRWAIGAVGIGMIAGHNLLDGIQAAQLGRSAGCGTSCTSPRSCTRRRGRRVRALSADPVDRGHGGRLRPGPGDAARARVRGAAGWSGSASV